MKLVVGSVQSALTIIRTMNEKINFALFQVLHKKFHMANFSTSVMSLIYSFIIKMVFEDLNAILHEDF